ncbi:unnamed protein product (macronuclear) [Paramecium tetraurelia]|uniref:Uncharacterized protein n=1 Tax=Paramecium tetraurelia TaxID=5888 RepID=A0BF97_PARTE|nr:uncharacterized protein GSPATT00028249001 [Paramecium tetraurelia]CAK57214.1 unnamed protein product [Paramecium tetraurelia]|eukprot:XP_001424612.1 hypothetical protein (macronuclear) [Paramecium tetraurelia strain d4-2]
MQSLCHYALPQFYTTTILISQVYLVTRISSISQEWSTLIMGIVQFLLSFALMVMIFIRHKFQMRKPNLFGLASCHTILSILLAIQQFDHYYLMLIILQQMAACLLLSLIVLNKNKIAVGIVFPLSLHLVWIRHFMVRMFQNQFSLSRAIAILGSGGVGLITMILCLLCQAKPQGKLQNELHIIIGFYIFCELFICCNIITEIINSDSSIYLIDLILLKVSNVLLDVLIYPFAKFHEPTKMQISKNKISSEIIENCNTRQFECSTIPTKESDYELDSALKIKSDKHIVMNKIEQCTSKMWIKPLLEIY